MPRLIRIALTLFASATILIIMVYKELQTVRDLINSGINDDFVANKSDMINVGFGMAGLFAVLGIILIIAHFVQKRLKATA